MFDQLEPYIGVIKGVAVSLILLGTFAAGYHSNKQADKVRAEWATERAKNLAAEHDAVLLRLAENQAVAKKQEANKQKLKKGYTDEIQLVDDAAGAARSVGLRINASACAAFAGTAEARGADGSDGAAAGTGALPEPYSRNLVELMREADAIVASCRVAQQFILDNGMAP